MLRPGDNAQTVAKKHALSQPAFKVVALSIAKHEIEFTLQDARQKIDLGGFDDVQPDIGMCLSPLVQCGRDDAAGKARKTADADFRSLAPDSILQVALGENKLAADQMGVIIEDVAERCWDNPRWAALKKPDIEVSLEPVNRQG